ncbi:carboxypeptidase regulatory-like domain-containing protein [Variovorax sp. PAMC 28711]|uniref:carboxypeptidase regulatory-like domain-containing protein n=1 Tax=Variovorax sp. PAMC 28711 TaxID=1795631 RepID=UPI0012E93978|nr:carboxypeptidase regulatory-like domain-containing protein [Variovorax sp. PAMC 28711]
MTVTDQTGATVCTTPTNADGTFSCTLPATTKAPLVIRATRDDQSLYSTTASAASGITNVTPLTTIVVAQLSPDGNPASLAGAIQTQPDLVTATTIQTQVTELVAALKPLLDALGQGALDVMSGAFTADGTGADKVLDSISVSVLPNGTSANIEVTVKTVPTADGAPPVSIVFNTSAPTPPLPTTAADLTASLATDFPTPTAVAALFQRLTACYALPLTTRVNGSGVIDDNTNATGTASNIAAPACKTLFVNDDPATFFSNGFPVGRDNNNNGSFAGIFRSGATGVVFDRGNVEYARSSAGEYVLSYRSTDRFGGIDNDTIIARNVDGVLKLTGNNYAYRVTLRPYSEDRERINSPAFSSFNTGYNISIDNKLLNSNPVFSKVEVTTPFDALPLTYYPDGNLSFLSISRNGLPGAANLQSTSIVRLAGAFQNPATQGPVSAKETGIYYVQPEYTEAQISEIPNQSVWSVKFFHVNTAIQPIVQTYRTISRAQTLNEIRQLKIAQLTDAQRAEMVAGSSATGRFTFGQASQADPNLIDFSSEGNLDAWTVPLGALAPTSLSAQGSAPPISNVAGARFNDGTSVLSTARKGIIYCARQGQNDLHCDPAVPSQYANGTSVDLFDLWARSSRQVEISKKVVTRALP